MGVLESEGGLTRDGPEVTGTLVAGDGAAAGEAEVEAPDPGMKAPAVGLNTNSFAATLNLLVVTGAAAGLSASAGGAAEAAALAALAAAAFAGSNGGMEGTAQADAFFCDDEGS